MQQQFYFDFQRRKGQMWCHYDGKKFRQKFVISGSASTMQQCIINTIIPLAKTSIKHTLLTKWSSSLQMFIKLYLKPCQTSSHAAKQK